MSAPVTMQAHAANYLSERRRLGFQLRSTGLAVMSFARYVDGLGQQGPLTVEVMADWARRDKWNSDEPSTWAHRLKMLRSFARYLQQFEPCTEVPDDSTFGRINRETQQHALAVTGAVVSTTGIAGLTLGGGLGWLMGKHGLALDNLRSVEIVTAEGKVPRGSKEENSDLFWAVRGGGGNFGIATSFEYQLHPVG